MCTLCEISLKSDICFGLSGRFTSNVSLDIWYKQPMFVLSVETTGPDCVFGNGIFQIGSGNTAIDLLCHGASTDISGRISVH